MSGSTVLAIATAALVTNSCGSSSTRAAAATRVKADYDHGRLSRIAYDSNGDGKPDTWAVMDGPAVVRLEVDEDGDGTIDRWEYHTGSVQQVQRVRAVR